MESAQLLQEAIKARANAYIPYSRFGVGAALLDQDGHVHHAAISKMLLTARRTAVNVPPCSALLPMAINREPSRRLLLLLTLTGLYLLAASAVR